jgi:hypothetical protein
VTGHPGSEEGKETGTGEDGGGDSSEDEYMGPVTRLPAPSAPFLWTRNLNHPIALLPYPETVAEANTSAPRRPVQASKHTGQALQLYDRMNTEGSEGAATGAAGTILGDTAQEGLELVAEKFPHLCGPDKTMFDIGSGLATTAALLTPYFGCYVGMEIDVATMRYSIDLLDTDESLGQQARITLGNVLRIPPVFKNVDAVYLYLGTIPTEAAIFSHVLHAGRRSDFGLIVFHSRAAEDYDTASCLELLCAAFDPEFKIVEGIGLRATEEMIFQHLTGSSESCAHQGSLQLDLLRWEVHNADMNGEVVDEKIKEYCYALPIDAKFRQHCNLKNSSSYEHIRRNDERQRGGIEVEAEAVIFDAALLTVVHDTDVAAVIEQSRRSHWHQIGDGDSSPIEDWSYIGCFSHSSLTFTHTSAELPQRNA